MTPSSRQSRPRLLLLALLLTGAYHGVLVLTRTGLKSDQASAQVFLASAYARAPFDPFDARWYAGAPLTGHAPLWPELVARLSGLLGLDGAYGAGQFLSVVTLLYGVYRFTLLLQAGPRAAGVASLLTLLGAALTLSLSVFGQVGAVLGAGLALCGAPALADWVQRGGARPLLGWLLPLLAAASASGAAPLLLLGTLAALPWGAGAARRRAALAAASVPVTLALLAAPDHAWVGPVTRIAAPDMRQGRAAWLTWLLPLGSLAWALPALRRLTGPGGAHHGAGWAGRWAAWPLSVRAAALSAPLWAAALASLLLAVPWRVPPETLTFLGTLLLTPFAAQVALRAWDDLRRGGRSPLPLLAVATLMILGSVSLNALPATRVQEGPALNLTPLLNFIEKDEHWRYRFLTVGFGRQLGAFSAQTRAATPSGLWHLPPDLPQPFAPVGEAARLPERLSLPGQGALSALLTHPERVNLKFVYARSDVLDPLLFLHGWHAIGTLENGVTVWEREDIPPVPARPARPTLPAPLGLLWGSVPLLALLGTLLLLPLSGRAWAQAPPLPGAALRPADLIRVPLMLGLLTLGALLAQAYRPSWVTQRTLATLVPGAQGGLRGPYARLESARLSVQRRGTAARVVVRERWWTPLGERRASRTVNLRLGVRGWASAPAPEAPLVLRRPTQSPQPAAAFYRAPRRITTNVTAPADVLDRPSLQVLRGRVSRDARGRLWYLGEVLCADARPADLTVTVTARLDGERVAEENLGLYGQHLLRSGERTPVRVLLTLPGGTTLTAAHLARLEVEVNARAVVSGRHLERPLVSRSRVRAGQVEVQARNVSNLTVAAPLALLTLYDARGVSWVHAAVGPELPPGATWTFTLPATPPAGTRAVRTVPPPAPADLTTVQPAARPPGAFARPGGAYRVSFVTLPAPERP